MQRLSPSQLAKTLFLPKTAFPMNSKPEQETKFLARIENAYTSQLNKPGKMFILHDGPPFANGDLHIGHALNKFLKDFIIRYKLMRGFQIRFVPGWDCHGLPIELKAIKQSENLAALEVRKRAKNFALQAIEKQKTDMIRWGLMADWSTIYKTCDYEFEANQLRIFAKLVKSGLVYQAHKPVYWSPSSKTALAEAELEYKDDHKSHTVFVALKLDGIKDQYLLIWTTTPWTLPANQAVAFNKSIKYSVYSLNGKHYIIADSRIQALQDKFQLPFIRVHEFCEFDNLKYQHPFWDYFCPVLNAEFVDDSTGSGLVHIAPSHGQDDFVLGQQNNLQTLCYEELAGKNILHDGNEAIINHLRLKNAVVAEEIIAHRYPYDWRSKLPVIQRATKQWFIDLKKIKSTLVSAVSAIQMYPKFAISRLQEMVTTREDWCISRQRHWGVPIPVFYDKNDNPLLCSDNIEHISKLFERLGSDCWWELDNKQLLHPKYSDDADSYTKGLDTMDGWLDSGVSWQILESLEPNLVADLYLEGNDQFRGWFQSSLIMSMATRNIPPFKAVVTHGFVVDEEGKKMSKSIGNVIEPSSIINGLKKTASNKEQNALGADVLRWWAASTDYSFTTSIGENILEQVVESKRKIRNCARFMLANTSGMHELSLLPISQMLKIDQFALSQLHQFIKEVESGYESYNFSKVYSCVSNFSRFLSSTYFETVKDRMYADSQDSIPRRSASSALFHILQAYTKSIAPALAFTSEEIYDEYKNQTVLPKESILQDGWIELDQYNFNQDFVSEWKSLMKLREVFLGLLDVTRKSKSMNTAFEAEVFIESDLAKKYASEIQILLGCAQVSFEDSKEDYEIVDENNLLRIRKSLKQKCPRCWIHQSEKCDELCNRCEKVLNK